MIIKNKYVKLFGWDIDLVSGVLNGQEYWYNWSKNEGLQETLGFYTRL